MLRALLIASGLIGLPLLPATADPLAEIRAGNQAFAEGRFEQAVGAFSRAIDSPGLDRESLALALNNRGVALTELGDFDRAIADYERALELKPADPKTRRNLRIAHLRRGLSAYRSGEFDRALADFGRAIELEPEHPTAWMRRGELRLERGELEGAIADLETAVRLAKDPTEAKRGLEQARAALAARQTAPARPAPEAPQSASAAPAPERAAPSPASASAPGDGSLGRTAAAAGGVPPEAGATRFRVTTDIFVRAEPATASAAVGSLRRGSEVTVRGEERGWYKVELSSGRTGWVYRRFLEAIEQPRE
ncbi:MAG: tetratricopeptide repeat protein [Geminicoccaceae bacterium]|nr:tetratricopeptide repeat protein [Geminicoccaceae bacterium]MCS7266594.1 tetratricopeptide repeat protein [Geminicoccaceae bacterium]MCX7630689.1 tetratricopeptide repeat protein [Geminicoccaceae bacterium]MDW8340113.1 tetratricopeptide repeat protein [Geminicoccaceae bacterium]